MMPGVYVWCITSLSSKVNQRILPSANADIFDHEQDTELVKGEDQWHSPNKSHCSSISKRGLKGSTRPVGQTAFLPHCAFHHCKFLYNALEYISFYLNKYFEEFYTIPSATIC